MALTSAKIRAEAPSLRFLRYLLFKKESAAEPLVQQVFYQPSAGGAVLCFHAEVCCLARCLVRRERRLVDFLRRRIGQRAVEAIDQSFQSNGTRGGGRRQVGQVAGR